MTTANETEEMTYMCRCIKCWEQFESNYAWDNICDACFYGDESV